MKLFGTVDVFIDGSARQLRLGRLQANAQFLLALLRYGTIDEYHFFCPSMSHLRSLEHALNQEVPEVVRDRRIVLATHLLLGEHLQREDYSAFHVGGWGLYLARLAYLRAQAGGRPFPITGVTHSLHTADIYPKMREMLKAPLGDGDAVVCTSQAGQVVMERHREEALRRAGEEGERPRGPTFRLPAIPFGVDEACFRVPSRLESRRALGLPGEAVVALYLGRLSAQSKADLVPLLATQARLWRQSPPSARPILLLAGGRSPAPWPLCRPAPGSWAWPKGCASSPT